MSRKIYNKLVRDKIPEIIKNKGDFPKISLLSKIEYSQALKQKMAEEAKELIKARSREDVLNELSDVQEIIKAIAKNHGITAEELEKSRKKKLKEKGGFGERYLLEYVDESEDKNN